jgi:transcription initiation factor TFIID subunit 2
MISALGDSLIPSSDASEGPATDSTEGKELMAAALSEIERFRTLDYVIPTYHNIVTVACLKVKIKKGGGERNLICIFKQSYILP